jgi:hypothetical protein
MKIIQQQSRCAQILDQVAKMPPGTPLVLTTKSGDLLFAGTRMSAPASVATLPSSLPTVPDSFAAQLLKAFVAPLDAFGLPASSLIDGVVRYATMPPQLASELRTLPPAPAGFDTLAALRDAQEARRRHPGGPPRVLNLLGTTFKVYDGVTLMGDLELRGDVILPRGTPQPRVGEQSAAKAASQAPMGLGLEHPLLKHAKKANEFSNVLGAGVDTLGKLYPELEQQIAVAGEVVEVLTIVTSGAAIIDALNKDDTNAALGHCLVIGANALSLAAKFSGDPNLRNIALACKFSNKVWAFFFPSKPAGAPNRA